MVVIYVTYLKKNIIGLHDIHGGHLPKHKRREGHHGRHADREAEWLDQHDAWSIVAALVCGALQSCALCFADEKARCGRLQRETVDGRRSL